MLLALLFFLVQALGVGVLISNHANAWNNVAAAGNGLSNIIDCYGANTISVFGNVSGATTIQVYYSQDGVNFYSAGTNRQIVLAGAGNFVIPDFLLGARYLQLQTTGAVTLTVTVSGKP